MLAGAEREGDARFHAARGRAYLALAAFKLALRDFEEALKRDPASAEGYAGRGFARVKLGEWRKGAADARKAVQCKPLTAYVFYSAACTLAQASTPQSGMGVQAREECLREGVELLRRAWKRCRPTAAAASGASRSSAKATFARSNPLRCSGPWPPATPDESEARRLLSEKFSRPRKKSALPEQDVRLARPQDLVQEKRP